MSRLLEDFNTLKSQNQNNPTVIYMSLLSTLKPHKPFKDFTGEDAMYVAKRLEELNDLEKGFQFLLLSVGKIITENCYDKEMAKNLIKYSVDDYLQQKIVNSDILFSLVNSIVKQNQMKKFLELVAKKREKQKTRLARLDYPNLAHH